MSRTGEWASAPSRAFGGDAKRLAGALRSAIPALLFGLRLWAAVMLALYLAFWLELDNAFWAGTSAGFVCLPSLGASLRKGWFRIVGTLVGAVAIVVLTACFPQQRIGFLLGLMLWGATCAFVSTLLRNFASYAAVMAGITVAIIAFDELGATGGVNGEAFRLAVARGSEICIGVISAGVVLAVTDFGGAPRRLAGLFSALSAEIVGGFANPQKKLPGPDFWDTRPERRDFLRRVIALDPVIDEAIGESSRLHLNSPVLQNAVDGLFAALDGWRAVAAHLMDLPQDQARAEANTILQLLPPEVHATMLQGEPGVWMTEPLRLRRACAAAVRALVALPAETPSLRLLANKSAEVWAGISDTLNGLALLCDRPYRPAPRRSAVWLHVPDWLPALVNAVRAFVTIGAVELFWIVTQWPSGAQAIAFATIAVILFAARGDQAYASTIKLMIGATSAIALAGVVKFALLPDIETFAGFSLALGLVLVPAGALMTQPWQAAMFTATAVFFIPFLAPANEMVYDIAQFCNAATGILGGVGAAALSFRLVPPVSPARRTRRLLASALRDLRRLATGPLPRTADYWKSDIYDRLSALPEQAEPLQRAQLLAALSTGIEIIRLRRLASRLDPQHELDATLRAVTRGDTKVAIERLAELDSRLAAQPATSPGAWARLRTRASILAISETLARHAGYFATGPAR